MPANDPTQDNILRDNINWHIDLISIQINHAQQVKGRARSGYYKMATMLVATIVEGVVHAIIVRKLGIDTVIPTGKNTYFACQDLPDTMSKENKLAICKRRVEVLEIKKNPDFNAMNNFCMKEKLYSKVVHKKIDDVRKMRNKIHLQGLEHIDRSYTIGDVQKIGITMSKVIDIYNTYNEEVS